MPVGSFEELFASILSCRNSLEVRAVLASLGDEPDMELDEPFGPLGVCWHAFDDNLSNISSIGLGTKPGRSLTERITNALDAVLEARKPTGVEPPLSCRAAAKQWFGRPITGPEEGLFRWRHADSDVDKLTQVVLQNSGIEAAPTIDVLDAGIGIRPEDFHGTILSLQRGNKLTRLYLIGAFGQGGASTLAFSDYALIISRPKEAPSTVGFTVIRVLNLSDRYKEDTYAYLALPNRAGPVTVPHVIREGGLELYSAIDGMKVPDFEHGTLVRHVAYKLPGIAGSLSPSSGNLYHYLHTSMFDPLLPFRVIDLRDPNRARDELVTGNRNRLMRLVARKADEDTPEGRIQVQHHRPMEYVTPHGGLEPSIGIEYWVVYAFRKGKAKGEQILRPSSSEVFAQPGHPIIGTLNGQNQGELTSKMLRDLGLGMVARHMVIHIDASQANSRIRRELFATNREGFKEGDVLRELTRVLHDMLKEDEELFRIEKELTDRLTKRESESASKEVREQISKLLLEAGFAAPKEGSAPTQGVGGEPAPVPDKKRRGYTKSEPLPTLPYPQVTKFSIVTPRPCMRVRLNDNQVVLVETDADAQFDREGRIAIRSEPTSLEQIGKAPLRGGRIRWRLRPLPETAAGTRGVIVATITKPDGSQIDDRVDFEVLPPREERTKRDKGKIPDFDVRPVSPEQEETWNDLWPQLGASAGEDELGAVAYKPFTASGQIVVYYSTVFGPYRAVIEKLKQENPVLAELFETSYKVWIGYHGILQENTKAQVPESLSEEDIERLMEEDRVRVAVMQVKQALQTAQLRQQLMKQQAEAE